MTVPAGAVVGGVGNGLIEAGKGVRDAYRPGEKGAPIFNQNRTIQAAGMLGVATATLAGVAAIAGLSVPGLGPITLPAAGALGVFAAGAGFVGAGVVNGVVAGVQGMGAGGLKGAKAGIGVAKATGAVAQEITDDAVKVVKQVAKDAVRAAGILVHNGAEATREGYEELSVKEADGAQIVADALKAKANAVANGGPRYDANGKKLADFPPDYKQL
ncbi:MAG: hypothetical protein ACAI38_22730 [Myxococcota bacterium]